LEALMRRYYKLTLLLIGLTAAGALPAQQTPQRAHAYASARDIPFDFVPNFLKLPTGLYLGEGIGVARNSQDHIFVYTRSGESSRLFEFDEDGEFVREIGRGAGPRPPKGSSRRRAAATPGRRPRSRTGSAARRTLLGTRTATSSSPTATSTPAS
jgi:hypothetical protein